MSSFVDAYPIRTSGSQVAQGQHETLTASSMLNGAAVGAEPVFVEEEDDPHPLIGLVMMSGLDRQALRHPRRQ